MHDLRSIPEGWREERLGDILELKYGTSLPEQKRKPGTIPVVGSAGIVGFHSQATVRGPGIVVGRKGSIGSVTWLDQDFVPIDTTYFVVPTNGIADLRWIHHLLVCENLARLNRATGVPGLNRDDVYALRRTVPPLASQRAIADVLDAIDQAVRRTETLISASEGLRDALVHELLTRGVPGWHTKWQYVPDLGTIPSGWIVNSLGSVAKVKGGKRLPKGSSFADHDTGLPYIRVVDFTHRTVNTDNVQFLRPATHKLIKSYTIRSSDVYLSIAGTIGLVGVVPVSLDRANLTENAAKIVITDPGSLAQNYLIAFLESHAGQGQIRRRVNALGQPKLALKRIRSIRVGLPPIDEQRTISASLASVDKSLNRAREERDALQLLKRSTAAALLTEQVRMSIATASLPTTPRDLTYEG